MTKSKTTKITAAIVMRERQHHLTAINALQSIAKQKRRSQAKELAQCTLHLLKTNGDLIAQSSEVDNGKV